MLYKCPFCTRTFSTMTAYTQHKNRCVPPGSDSSNSELITNVNDIEVRNYKLSYVLA